MARAKKRVSLQDIADACGLSRNSVSLALRNSPSLAPATKDKIHETAQRLGYVADPKLARLMTYLGDRKKKPGLLAEIAYISTVPQPDNGPTHLCFFEPARDFLQQHGYRLSPYLLHEEGHSQEEARRILRARGVVGTIVAPMGNNCDQIELDWAHLAGVAIGRALKVPNLAKVDIDHYHAMQVCCRAMEELGYQRIGAVIPYYHDKLLDHVVRSAFLGSQGLPGIKHKPFVLDHNRPKFHYHLPQDMLENWVDRNKIDAVIALPDVLPQVELIWKKQGCGPEQLGFASWRLYNEHHGRVAGIIPNTRGVGLEAARQVMTAINHGIYGEPDQHSLTVIRGTWTAGTTVRSAKAN